jgi:hypothetical protein
MATTITSQSLTATISEQITLNGQAINSENQLVITNINEIDKRIVTIPTASEVTVIAFSTAVAAGQFIAANVKYIRITNKDDTNFVRIRVKKTGAETFDIKLDAGKSFLMGNNSESVSATAGAFSAFVTADSINAQADTASVDIEYFVASI